MALLFLTGGRAAVFLLTRYRAGANVSASSSSSAESLKYRIPLQSSIDGNTVEAEREQAAFADNTVRYQATLQFLGGKFSSMKTAITGGR